MVKPARARTSHRCQSCGHEEPRWLGRCPTCGEWNSLIEHVGIARNGRAARGGPAVVEPIALADVSEDHGTRRLVSGIAELDRVLGGGLVPGSLVLLGGDPGVGKSTLLSQMLAGLAERAPERPVLYASGEESVAQVALRARRVGGASKRVAVLAETSVERILEAADKLQPSVLAIDSIQTVQGGEVASLPGSVGQVRDCAARLLAFAKQSGVPTILVGHVTKDGNLAGPKTLEHVVDVVLQFDGEGASAYRILRSHKNRFGSTHEIGVFEMGSAGLVEVANPSSQFLAERPLGVPGSVVVASAEGSRTILVEVQALVTPATAGLGRRTTAGVDSNRVSLLLAVLAQRAGLDILARDVFVNVAGGLRLDEPAVDLGIACALASSARGRAIDPGTAVFGEVGLAGEVRAVSLAEARLAEAKKLGFARCLLPKQNRDRLQGTPGIELVAIDRLATALAAL